MNIKEFEKKIGYAYNNVDLLKLALTHSSYGNEVYKDKLHNNERLEFLGDAVLELTVSDYLFNEECNMPEGSLSRKRASIVCEPTLAMCAREINLPEVLFMGKLFDRPCRIDSSGAGSHLPCHPLVPPRILRLSLRGK